MAMPETPHGRVNLLSTPSGWARSFVRHSKPSPRWVFVPATRRAEIACRSISSRFSPVERKLLGIESLTRLEEFFRVSEKGFVSPTIMTGADWCSLNPVLQSRFRTDPAVWWRYQQTEQLSQDGSATEEKWKSESDATHKRTLKRTRIAH